MIEKELKLDSKNRFKVKACPCGKSNKDGKFVPFDNQNKYGYCHSCSELHLPDENDDNYFGKVNTTFNTELPINYIPYHYLIKSLKKSSTNNLITFLRDRFGNVDDLVNLYKIGSSKQWYGANVFWYIDKDNNVRTGKIMLYNKQSGKRVKEPYNHINWVHSKLKMPKEYINKCLFGEHLINVYPNRTIAIVESEKTALIASLYFPNLIWLATGGIANLNYGKIKALRGRNILLFPDLGAYDLWLEKATFLKTWFNISVSDYLEKQASATDKEMKYDLADYLLKIDKNQFLGIYDA